MKRKFIAALLLTLSMTFNVHGEEVNTAKPIVNKIDYRFISDIILDRNSTVKTQQNNLDKLFIQYRILRDAEDDMEDKIEEMKDLLSLYKVQPIVPITSVISEVPEEGDQSDLNSDNEEGDISNPDIDGINLKINGIMKSLENINKALEAMKQMNIKSMDSSIDSMEDQLESIDRQQADLSSLIDSMKVQNEMVNNQIIWAGENLVFAYDSIEKTEKDIDENLALLENKLRVLKVQKDLGYVTTIDEDGLKLSIEDLKNTKDTLNLKKEDIKRQLNLLLGQPYDTSLDIVFEPYMKDSKLNLMDKEDDLETALANNYTIKLQEYEVESREIALDRAGDDHGKGSNEYKLAEEELENVKLSFQDTVEAQELKFQQLYEAVKDKQKVLSLEEKKLEQEKRKMKTAKLKYDLGVISKSEYDDAKLSYDLQSIKLQTTESDLFTAYRKYGWMIKGLEIQG